MRHGSLSAVVPPDGVANHSEGHPASPTGAGRPLIERRRRILTHPEIVEYLLHSKLVALRDVVRGDLRVSDVSRRNCNTRVENTRGPSFLVKQGVGFDADESLRREARIYRWINSTPHRVDIRGYLPRCYRYDGTRAILVLELLSGVEDLERVYSRGSFPVALAARQGKMLADLHRASPPDDHSETDTAGSLPWVFNIDTPALPDWLAMSLAAARVVGIIQTEPAIVEGLRTASSLWRPTALTHGDFRWANQLSVIGPKRRPTGIKVVDWEYGGRGDPAWDIAGLFSSYLSLWVLGMPISAVGSAPDWDRLSRYPLPRMQPAISSFWQAYLRRAGIQGNARQDLLWRSMVYSAARLLQIAIEHSQSGRDLTANAGCLLQLSRNIFDRPHEAIVHLLGIKLCE